MKARRDLLSAKKLARGKEPYFDTAIYHCQQLAEKVIKGWLVYNDISFSKTHDLRLLVALAAEVESGFDKWHDVAEQNHSVCNCISLSGRSIGADRR
ncbi:MAG: HEPN domain-containing protein [Chloroflexi bacterium]|nr:HEPN domain-containing protein [Chloroflexota bacterium]